MADEIFLEQLTQALTLTATPVMQGTWATVRADYVKPIGIVPVPLRHLHALAFKLKNQAEKSRRTYLKTPDNKNTEDEVAMEIDLLFDRYEVTRKLLWKKLKEKYPVPLYSPELVILEKWRVGQLIKPIWEIDPSNSIDLLNIGINL